ncbi:MAG: hypothetical protein AB7L13_07865 [Acidimicrobiia bacterium]
MAALAETGDRVADELRERGEPEAAIESSIAALGVVMYAYLNQLWADPEHPRFMPGAGFYTFVGTPNPDTIYRTATIDGAGTYRLTGERGTVPDVTVMAFGAPGPAGMRTFTPFDLDSLSLDRHGRFDVTLGPRPSRVLPGDWWPSDPEMRSLMLRSVSADWGSHAEPSISIVRLDAPARRARADAATIETMLAGVPVMVERMLQYGLRKLDQLHAGGYVNALASIDYSAGGGLPGQYYDEGIFELPEGKALLLEAQLPPGAEFSLSLTDVLFATIDWANAQSSLNHRQAVVVDGVLRVVVAADDPGAANWLDTTGHHRGVLQCRWMRCDTAPPVSLSLIDARRASPDDLARRDDVVRRRNAAVQLRRLW